MAIPLFVAIVLTAVAGHGYFKRCPKCGWWWMGGRADRKLAGKQRAYKTVTRRDQHTFSGSILGSGTTERHEQIVVWRLCYHDHYSCEHCNHQWIKEVYQDVED